MAGNVFDCVFLVVLFAGQLHTNFGLILNSPDSANPSADIEYVLKVLQVIHGRQSQLEKDFEALNSTYDSITGDIGGLNDKTSQLTSNITKLKSQSGILSNDLKTINQTILNVSAKLIATESEVTRIKPQITSLTAKTDDLEAKFKTLNTTLVNVDAQNKQKMEEITNNVVLQISSVKAENADLKSHLTALKQNVTKMKTESEESHTERNVTNTEIEKLKNENKVFKAQTTSLQNEITDMKASIKTLQGHQEHGIMFMAMFSIDRYKLAQLERLTFDLVTLNLGNGYNGTSGKFKAPEPGVYLFFAQIQSRIAGLVYARIVKKGKDASKAEDIAEIYTAKETGVLDEAGGTHVMITLAAGDEIWVTRNGGADSYYGLFRSHFTGFRIPGQ